MLISRLNNDQLNLFSKIRQEWFDQIMPFDGIGISRKKFPEVMLPTDKQLDGARIFSNRYKMITDLARPGMAIAEVGVQEDYLANLLLKILTRARCI